MLPAARELVFDCREARADGHSSPDLDAGHLDTVSHGADLAHTVSPADVWHLQLQPRPTTANPQIEMIESRRTQVHDHLSMSRLGVGSLTVLEHVYIAMFAE